MTEGITISIRYADYLQHTLPSWLPYVDRMLVVTVEDDEATREVCRIHNVETVFSQRIYEKGRFCKGKAMCEGLMRLERQGRILILDSDIYLPAGLNLATETGYLYGMYRKQAESSQDIHRSWAHLRDPQPGGSYATHVGFFQLFHADDERAKMPGYPCHSTTAADDDLVFRGRWPTRRWRLIDGLCLHLGPSKTNWYGRVSPVFE